MVKRIFIEKKQGFDVEAKNLLADLKNNVGIENLQDVRLFVLYDCENLTDEEFAESKNIIFCEPPVDNLYEETLPQMPEHCRLNVKPLPGQYDQRSDFAEQSLRALFPETKCKISAGKTLAFIGNISQDEFNKIKDYYINPVESSEVLHIKPDTITAKFPEPKDVSEVKINENTIKDLGLAMNQADLDFCDEYFKKEGRQPTLTEIKVLDTYWSDHCRHTTFSTHLNFIRIDVPYIKAAYIEYITHRNQDKPITLMDIATAGAKRLAKEGKLKELDISEEINACSIEIDVDNDGVTEKWLLMFKNETHNHPTEIEPFGGAATCLGGAIRDPLSGRSYVYQAMRITGSGDPTVGLNDTLPGKLSQRKITTTAAAGYSSYGNQIGLATGQVNEIYDEGYVAKRMELGAVIAAAPKTNVIRMQPKADDIVILLGGKTGRDGCGGATGSSKAHDEKSLESCGAEVQKGNPPQERAIARLFRNPEATRLIKRCNDFGAGGVSVAIGELAPGLEIDLDKVPKKYEGLDGTELAISESQERMAVVISPNDKEKFFKLADEENLECTLVAKVTDKNRLTMTWRGKTIVDMSRDFLDSNGASRSAEALIKAPNVDAYFNSSQADSLNSASQKGLIERFDSSIGASTVLMPLGGETQLTPADAMVAKIPMLSGNTSTCSIMSFAYSPKLSKLSPFHGAVYAVLQSVAKVVACGGDASKVYLTLQEYFPKLGNDSERWGQPLAALLGAYYAQIHLGVAAIGGKDSMSGSFGDLDVPPTLVSFAVNWADSENIVSPEFKRSGHDLVLIEIPKDENNLPNFEVAKELYEKVRKLAADKRIYAAHALGDNGLSDLFVQCLGNNVGAEIEKGINVNIPRPGDIVLEVSSGNSLGFGEIIGRTVSEEFFNKTSLKTLKREWEKPLSTIFPLEVATKSPIVSYKTSESIQRPNPNLTFPRPRVIIPVFPGTNCEYDSARAFERAGGKPEILVIRNLTSKHIEESVNALSEKINNSQILMLPGGFSAGDEPDGSAKYITALLRHPKLKDAIENLLNKNDGLILGVCNGFQALIKLGLLPYGEMKELKEDSPTLTYNAIGRHISKMVKTRIASNKSPWLNSFTVGETHIIPISHGEGRLVASDEVLEALKKNGQIATQYVENPNGSAWGIEGLTSPDGRVFGKMAHSERAGKDIAKNIPGNKIQDIFKNGVKYYA